MGELSEAGAQAIDGARQEADAYRGDNPRPPDSPSAWSSRPDLLA